MSCLARGLAWRTMSAVAFIIASVSLYALVASQQQSPAPYVLRVMREDESSQGSAVDLMTLQCLDSSDQVMRPQEVVFWLNRNAPNDPDFKDRDYVIVDNDLREIVFQLREEGNYTCGIRTDVANVEESEPVPLIGE